MPISSALPTPPVFDERLHLKSVWWQLLLLGLVSIILGMMAVSSSVVATMASVVVFGVLLIVAGVTEVIHALIVRNGKGFALHLLSAALYLFVGIFVIEDPVRVAVVLTLVLAAAFLVGGLLRIIFSIAVRFPAWPWVMLNGVVNLILGAMIWSEWPSSSLWLIGTFVGIDLIFHGWAWVVLALNVRSHQAEMAA